MREVYPSLELASHRTKVLRTPPRFRGLRFQVTCLYIPWFKPVSEWEDLQYDDVPPVRTVATLLDIINCPGKDGTTVVNTIEKQLRRLGLTKLDIFVGCGDGGGENEGGTNGVHVQFEREDGTYVRHRCFGHFSWRSSDAIIRASGDDDALSQLNRYFKEGITWFRMKAIAVQPIDAGGANLMAENSICFAIPHQSGVRVTLAGSSRYGHSGCRQSMRIPEIIANTNTNTRTQTETQPQPELQALFGFHAWPPLSRQFG